MAASPLEQSLQSAILLLEQGKHDEARRRFDEILAQTPSSLEARYGASAADLPAPPNPTAEAGHLQFLRQTLGQEAIKVAAILVHAGTWLVQRGQVELAEKAFAQARNLQPDEAAVALAWGECQLALGNSSAAEALARRIPNESAEHGRALFLLGRALYAERRFVEAIEAFRMANSRPDASDAVRDYLALTLSLAKRWDKSVEVCELSTSPEKPKSSVMLFVTARYLMRVGELALSEKIYLGVLWSLGYLAARDRAREHKPQKPNDLNVDLLWSWWPSYAECVRRQGWFDRALAERAAPLDSLAPVDCPDVWSAPSPRRAGQAITLLSFSSDDVLGAFQKNLSRSALDVGGFDHTALWTSVALRETKFFENHSAILSLFRGAGVWAWKPYIIYNELMRRPDGDYVVYYDVGRKGNRFTRPVDDIIAWCERSPHGILPGVELLTSGPNKWWTKRDCFSLMGCDVPEYLERPQIQATFSFWKNSPFARSFVLEWLKLAVDPRIISDYPNVCGKDNHTGFLDHRHDQSILTNLVIRHGLSLPRYDFKDINAFGESLAVGSST